MPLRTSTRTIQRKLIKTADVTVMNQQAFFRLILLFGVVLAGGYTYETQSISDHHERTGTVVHVETDAYPVAQTNDTVYTIQYRLNDQERSVKTTLGAVARYVSYRNVEEGDRIPVLVDPESPSDAMVHSFADTHPFTISAGALFLLLLAVGSWTLLTSSEG